MSDTYICDICGEESWRYEPEIHKPWCEERRLVRANRITQSWRTGAGGQERPLRHLRWPSNRYYIVFTEDKSLAVPMRGE